MRDTKHLDSSARGRRRAVATLCLAVLAVAPSGGDAGAAPNAQARPQARPQAHPQAREQARGQAHGQARGQAPKGYAAQVQAWHDKPQGAAPPQNERGETQLRLFALNTRESLTLTPSVSGARMYFDAEELERATRFLRDPRTGDSFPIQSDLLVMALDIEKQFAAHEIRIISGYRTPKPGGRSNHGRGRALDIVVPGAADEDVAKFVRERGFVGVGTYPISGFVHVDLRAQSYFWVDTSGPGRARREHGILPEVAQRSDARAKAAGRVAIGPFAVGTDVDQARQALGAVATTSAAATHADPETDDDE